jgi:hypothetical protein
MVIWNCSVSIISIIRLKYLVSYGNTTNPTSKLLPPLAPYLYPYRHDAYPATTFSCNLHVLLPLFVSSFPPKEPKLTHPSRRIHTPRSVVRYRDADRHYVRMSSCSSPPAQTCVPQWLPLLAQIVTSQRHTDQVGNWHRQSQPQDLAKSLLQDRKA